MQKDIIKPTNLKLYALEYSFHPKKNSISIFQYRLPRFLSTLFFRLCNFLSGFPGDSLS